MPQKVRHEQDSFDDKPNSAQVDAKTVAFLFGCTVCTVWRRTAAGKLPAPRYFGSSARWNVGELREVLAYGNARARAA